MTSQPTPSEVLNGESEYARAVMFATRNKPSCSYLQRRMQLPYNLVVALMERMEAAGLISASNAAGKRTILVPYVERLQPSGGQDGGGEDLRAIAERVIAHGYTNTAEYMLAAAFLASPAKATGWQGIEAHDNSATEVLVMAEGWSKPIVAWRHHLSSRTDIWLSTPGRYQVKPTHFHALPPRPEDEGAA